MTFLHDDPFQESKINSFKDIQTIDLRSDIDADKLIDTITFISEKVSPKNSEWTITMQLYELEAHIEKIIKKIIDIMVSQNNLQPLQREIFFCLKELAINASKANYKRIFEKYFTPQLGVSPNENYNKFLDLFKEEIEKSGNKLFFKLAKLDDQFYTITFQSTVDSIKIWVTNTKGITPLEKERILRKISPESFKDDLANDDTNAEGAGFGLDLIMNILKEYTKDPNPLKCVFYDDFIKMGFEFKHSEIKSRT